MENVGVEQHLYCLTSTVLSLNENSSCEFGVVKVNFIFNVKSCIAMNIKVYFIEMDWVVFLYH